VRTQDAQCVRCGKEFTHGIDYRRCGNGDTSPNVYLVNGRAAETNNDINLCRKCGLAHDSKRAKRTKATGAILKKLTRAEREVLKPMIEWYEDWY